MKRASLSKLTILAGLTAAFVMQTTVLGSMYTLGWSRSAPIVGDDQPGFIASVSAEFVIDGSTLRITLTNDSSMMIKTIAQVLTGLTWDITDPEVVLSPMSAIIPDGSRLVNPPDASTDLSHTNGSPEWAFRSDLSAGSGSSGPLGSFGIGTMGDVNFGADTFGPKDRFDTDGNLFGPEGLNGVEVGLVGPDVDFSNGGFTKQGPVVQGWSDNPGEEPGQTVFTFTIGHLSDGTLTADEIENIQALFGTSGAPHAPEPLSLVVWLLIGLTWAGSAWVYRMMSRGREWEQEEMLALATCEGSLDLRGQQTPTVEPGVRTVAAPQTQHPTD